MHIRVFLLAVAILISNSDLFWVLKRDRLMGRSLSQHRRDRDKPLAVGQVWSSGLTTRRIVSLQDGQVHYEADYPASEEGPLQAGTARLTVPEGEFRGDIKKYAWYLVDPQP